MKSKTPLVLMEQLIMVLVFALAAAVCLRLFAVSEQISRKNEAISQAVLIAQNAAEQLKSSQGDPEAAAQILLPDSDEWEYRLEIREEETSINGMGSARILVYGRDGKKAEELLFEIPTAWQEELENEK